MSHNLEQRDGQTSMFYVGNVPWHQLGRKLDKPVIAVEAMETARLDMVSMCHHPKTHFCSDICHNLLTEQLLLTVLLTVFCGVQLCPNTAFNDAFVLVNSFSPPNRNGRYFISFRIPN